MKNFLIFIRYSKPIDVIEQHTTEHRSYLKSLYDKGLLMWSGPFVPRTAGVLWSRADSRETVDNFVANDPFRKADVADYEVIEFNPVMWSKELDGLLGARE